jgi:hypothetical protein
VDDLVEISHLERYVAASQCVLVMLTSGYFQSRNCLREVHAAIEQKKPMVLVHEADTLKGGASLEDLSAEAASKSIDAAHLFGGTWPIIVWQRVSHFQFLSLRLVVEATVHAMPPYRQQRTAPRLYSRSEITSGKLVFSTPVTLYLSDANPGAGALGDELVARCNCDRLRLLHKPPAGFAPAAGGRSVRRRRRSRAGGRIVELGHAQDHALKRYTAR